MSRIRALNGEESSNDSFSEDPSLTRKQTKEAQVILLSELTNLLSQAHTRRLVSGTPSTLI